MRRPWRFELLGIENVANVSGYSQVSKSKKKVKPIVSERALMRRPWRFELLGIENVANVSGYSQISK
jgi:hypothetical protein